MKKKNNKSVKKSINSSGKSDYADFIGRRVLIRTVSLYYVGEVKEERAGVLVLSLASWVADTGRFSVALATGKLGEVEPYVSDVLVAKGAIVDVTEWKHDLPRVAI